MRKSLSRYKAQSVSVISAVVGDGARVELEGTVEACGERDL
jgi:hypothetical protein